MVPTPRSAATRLMVSASRPSASATTIAASTISVRLSVGCGPRGDRSRGRHSNSRLWVTASNAGSESDPCSAPPAARGFVVIVPSWYRPARRSRLVWSVGARRREPACHCVRSTLDYCVRRTQIWPRGAAVAESGTAILADGLSKRYGSTWALDGLELAVPYGIVYGLLGPNGAGKTTAVRILTTLTRLDKGRALVAGFDVARQPRQVRRHIGLTGQHMSIDELLSARQNLEMFGKLFHIGRRAARRRADELLEQFGLADVATKAPKTFSG